MKEEIEKLIDDKANEVYPDASLTKSKVIYSKGAGWLYSQYSISPSTVTEMIEALRYTLTKTHDDHVYDVVNEVLSKADKELKK